MTSQPPDAAVARLMSDAAAEDVLDLSIGEPDQPMPAVLLARAVASLQAGETGYTPKLGLMRLRRAIAASLPVPTAAEDVVITVGGTEAVAVGLTVTCRAGDTIVVPDPAWPNYRVLATALGLTVRTYRQGADPGDFFDWPAIEQGLAAGARLVVVNSPSNPMAAVASAAELQRLVDLARAHQALVLSDQAYEAITFDGTSAPSAAAAEGADEVVFLAQTFSKTYSMTGLRVGALISPSRFRTEVAAVHGTMVGCAPRTAQLVAEQALADLPERGRELGRIYRERFDVALRRLGRWMPQSQTSGHGGFYVWLDGRHTGMTADQLTEALAARGVRVSSGNAYTTTESHAVRLALTAPTAQLEFAFRAIEQIFTVHRGDGRDSGGSEAATE